MGEAHADGHVVSVVIPTVNRGTLTRTMAALQAQTRPPDAIVVVEDTGRRGASWARNEGIRRASGDLVAFTDDDTVPPTDWLARLIDAIDRYGADGAGGTQQETDPLLADKNRRHAFPDREGIDDRGWVCDTSNLVYRRALLDGVIARDGFVFDERFPSAEDTELAWRLRRRGAKLVYVPNRVRHLRVGSPRVYLAHQFSRGEGIGMLYLAQRRIGGSHQAGNSRIWGASASSWLKWPRVLFHKGFGPFDVGSFHSVPAYLLFWVGTKIEALGFFRAVARNRRTFVPAGYDGEGIDR